MHFTRAAEPAVAEERNGMLDTTRGIAVLGILLMNITAFGLPHAYDNPTQWGGHEGIDLATWRTVAWIFEGTMRGLFTVLFGAGVVLYIERHARRHPDLRPAGLYFRRTLWLIVFGLVNGYVLLWPGDILFYYGAVGLLLFLFRTARPAYLIALAVIILAAQTGVTAAEWADYRQLQAQAQGAQAAKADGQSLTTVQRAVIEAFTETNEKLKPRRATLEQRVADIRESYLGALRITAHETWYQQTVFFLRHGLLESLGMMLLGMALLKTGVLTGAAPRRLYGVLLAAGYVIGLAVNVFETSRLEDAAFSTEALLSSYLTYDLGRVPMTLGHLGLIGLLYRAPRFARAGGVLACVGRLALTNYLMQSLICMFVFTGAGLALYGQLERHQLYYVVAAIWIAQLVFSPSWLRHFRFGPAEWLWRSLTYWEKLPMRRSACGP
jgi:uncharacterized protein